MSKGRFIGISGLVALALVGCSGEVQPDDDYGDAEDLRSSLQDEGFNCTGGDQGGSEAVSRLTCDEGHELAVWDADVIFTPQLDEEQHHILAGSWSLSSDSQAYVQSAREVFGGDYRGPEPEPEPEPTPTPQAVSPGERVTITCRDSDNPSSDPHDSFEEAWESLEPDERVRCEAMFNPRGVEEESLTEAEAEALEISGYDEPESLSTLYSLCAQAFLGDYQASKPWSQVQIDEVEGALTLCPDHPERAETEERMVAAADREEARERGDIVRGGDHRVGESIQPGTYVAESETGFDGCYWERLDSAGNIIANNFMSSGFRAEVYIDASDYSFSSSRCGEWEKQ